MGLDFGMPGGTSASAPETSSGLVLTKGAKVELTKTNPGLDAIRVGLGWDVNASGGNAFDLDASAFLLGANGKLVSQKHVVFFNQQHSPDGAVNHQGDNLTGQGDGDDETILVELSKVAPEVQKIVFAVNIFEAMSRRQNFGQVSNAYIRIVDDANNQEVCRYDLTEDYSMSISVVVGEVYRHDGEWKFGALGQGSNQDLSGLLSQYGL